MFLIALGLIQHVSIITALFAGGSNANVFKHSSCDGQTSQTVELHVGFCIRLSGLIFPYADWSMNLTWQTLWLLFRLLSLRQTVNECLPQVLTCLSKWMFNILISRQEIDLD